VNKNAFCWLCHDWYQATSYNWPSFAAVSSFERSCSYEVYLISGLLAISRIEQHTLLQAKTAESIAPAKSDWENVAEHVRGQIYVWEVTCERQGDGARSLHQAAFRFHQKSLGLFKKAWQYLQLTCNVMLMSPWTGILGNPVTQANTNRRSEGEESCQIDEVTVDVMLEDWCTCMKRQNHTTWSEFALQPSYLKHRQWTIIDHHTLITLHIASNVPPRYHCYCCIGTTDALSMKNSRNPKPNGKTVSKNQPAVVVELSVCEWLRLAPLPRNFTKYILIPAQYATYLQSRIVFLRQQARGWWQGVFWRWLQHTRECCCQGVTYAIIWNLIFGASSGQQVTSLRNKKPPTCSKHGLQHNQKTERTLWHRTSFRDDFQPSVPEAYKL
jgi:hypothetical protein